MFSFPIAFSLMLLFMRAWSMPTASSPSWQPEALHVYEMFDHLIFSPPLIFLIVFSQFWEPNYFMADGFSLLRFSQYPWVKLLQEVWYSVATHSPCWPAGLAFFCVFLSWAHWPLQMVSCCQLPCFSPASLLVALPALLLPPIVSLEMSLPFPKPCSHWAHAFKYGWAWIDSTLSFAWHC